MAKYMVHISSRQYDRRSWHKMEYDNLQSAINAANDMFNRAPSTESVGVRVVEEIGLSRVTKFERYR